ncbi:RsiV family protein [Methylosinus sporium]|uniref:RsiV family protein n=1 Tax=Methylosinus sporium TaxID=428 RepID=UPI00383A9481
MRTDTYDAHCRDPIIKGKILSVQYAVHWYGAGAAHPNMYFLTYSFLLDPLTLLSSTEEIFINSSDALEIIQRHVRSVLMSSLSMDDCDGDSLSDDDASWIYNGTGGWECFSAFVFAENGIEFLFSPYSVACYASGPQFANVPYEQIVHHLKPAYCYALGVDHLKWQKR